MDILDNIKSMDFNNDINYWGNYLNNTIKYE